MRIGRNIIDYHENNYVKIKNSLFFLSFSLYRKCFFLFLSLVFMVKYDLDMFLMGFVKLIRSN